MKWLIAPELGINNNWLTPNVEATMEAHLQGVPQLEAKSVIESEIAKWAELAFGSGASANRELMAKLYDDFSNIQPLRFAHLIKPLAVDGLYSGVPPAAMVPHANKTVTPYTVQFPDGGRLILIDPLNHIFLTPLCFALLFMACYDLTNEHLGELLDFIYVTSAFFSSDRHIFEQLLNKKEWNELSQKLMNQDQGLGSIAENLAFNIIAFALYHEASHSLLGHLGERGHADVLLSQRKEPRPVLTWRQAQELEADAQGCEYFRSLLAISGEDSGFWTGPRFDHAPMIYFRLLSFLNIVKEKLTGEKKVSELYPPAIDRLGNARQAMGNGSDIGEQLYNLTATSLTRLEAILDVLDLKAHLSPEFMPDLLSG